MGRRPGRLRDIAVTVRCPRARRGTFGCGRPGGIDLRVEQNLDVLGVDDQISTGQHAAVWEACHRLADAARRWWDDLDAIVYRSRTSPATSTNLGFFASDAFATESWPLAERTHVLTDLVLRHGFTVGWDFTAP